MANDVFPSAILRQLKEWGYPQMVLRAVPNPDDAFGVLHITGNPRLPSADGELDWRINDPANQNSATFFINRDGSIRQALGDPLRMAPWANGAARNPDMTNPRIARCIRAGVNPNMRTIVAIECVGYEPGSSITPEQEKSAAAIFAYYFGKAGVPINRETIIGHYQIDSVERPNCPARDKSIIERVVNLALGEDPAVIAELEARIAELENIAARRWRRIQELVAKRDALMAQVDSLEAEIVALEQAVAEIPALRHRLRVLKASLASVKAAVAALNEEVNAPEA